MTQEALKQMYQLLLTEPHAPTVCAQLERIAREALADHAMQEVQRLGQEIEHEPLEYWNAVEGWVKIDEVREHFDSVGCATIYKTSGEGRVPLSLAKAQPEQEPVAFASHGVINWIADKQFQHEADLYITPPQRTERPVDCERCNRLEEQAYDLVGELRVANIKLSMRPQRTWVGLTDEELSEFDVDPIEAKLMIAKLKEKNT